MRILKQISSSLLVKLALLIGTFLTGVLVVRGVGAEGKGVLSLLGSMALMLSVVAGFGLPTSIAYLYKQKKFANEELFGVTTAIWLMLLILLGLLLSWQYDTVQHVFFGEVLSSISVQPFWLWLSFATLPGLLLTALLSATLVIDENIKIYMVWSVFSQLLGIALTWAFVLWFGWGVTGVLVATLFVQITPFIAAFWWLKYKVGIRGWRFSVPALTEMSRLGFQQYAVTLLATAFKRGEIIVLSLLLDMRSLGFYAVATGLYELVNEVPRSVVWPMVGRLAESGNTNQAEETTRSIRLQIIVMLFLVGVIGLVSPVLIPAIYGPEFQTTVLPFLWLLPGVLFRTVQLSISSYFIGIGEPGMMSWSVTAGAVVSLGLDLVLVPRMGLQGAAIGTLIAEICMAGISVWLFLRSSHQFLHDLIVFKQSDFLAFPRLLSSLAKKYK